AQGNHCGEAGLRVARGILRRRLVSSVACAVISAMEFGVWRRRPTSLLGNDTSIGFSAEDSGHYNVDAEHTRPWRLNRLPIAKRVAITTFSTATKRASNWRAAKLNRFV